MGGQKAVADGGVVTARFSSNDWPEPKRLEATHDLYAARFMRCELDPLPDSPLHLEADVRVLPDLMLGFVTASAMQCRRKRHHLVSDDFSLNIGLAGRCEASQCGRDAIIVEEGAFLTTGAQLSSISITASRFINVCVQAKALSALVPDVHDRVARQVPPDTDALRLLIGYAETIRDKRAIATPQACRLAVTHITDLVALALGAAGDVAEMASLRGARAARLRAIKADVVANLGNDLSVAAVAVRHRLPVRYLQRLFEADGATFTEFVLGERLARAHRLLSDQRLADRPIGTIAFECGFANQAYFNQAFRRRYGMTPSGVRAARRP
jgi:AraC-like DNA-binding protein